MVTENMEQGAFGWRTTQVYVATSGRRVTGLFAVVPAAVRGEFVVRIKSP
jgi:hypothetical protein